jgi:hypothetical protein
MNKITIDLEDLIIALTSNFDSVGGAYFLDMETGELILFSEEFMEDPSYGIPEDIEDNPRYLRIIPFRSHDTFVIMEDFIDTLGSNAMVDRLANVLKGKKPFRRFKDALYEYPDLPDQWFEFQHIALTRMAEEWCRQNQIRPAWKAVKFICINSII